MNRTAPYFTSYSISSVKKPKTIYTVHSTEPPYIPKVKAPQTSFIHRLQVSLPPINIFVFPLLLSMPISHGLDSDLHADVNKGFSLRIASIILPRF
ncbi:hypothetical protein RJT34_30435 [Clitoria ternatea]|uniref:Uncharacterized protein n=1 Tax=Clitoria ternatea TaxID=43366 RepID=A0AAN9I2M3_CLITE